MQRLQRLSLWLGWATLAFIVFATLCPIGVRPHLAGANVERFGAFLVVGFLFILAYPRHTFAIVGLVIGAAIVLEVGQTLEPDRHGRLADAAVKIFGGSIGMAGALLFRLILEKVGFALANGRSRTLASTKVSAGL